jgi:hypothetical protein
MNEQRAVVLLSKMTLDLECIGMTFTISLTPPSFELVTIHNAETFNLHYKFQKRIISFHFFF